MGTLPPGVNINQDLGVTVLKAMPLREPDELRMVYVGNLPWSLKWPELQQHMKAAGDVKFSKIFTHDGPMWGRSRGTGYVLYATEREAKRAVATLNQSNIGGRQLIVDEWTVGKSPVGGTGGKRLSFNNRSGVGAPTPAVKLAPCKVPSKEHHPLPVGLVVARVSLSGLEADLKSASLAEESNAATSKLTRRSLIVRTQSKVRRIQKKDPARKAITRLVQECAMHRARCLEALRVRDEAVAMHASFIADMEVATGKMASEAQVPIPPKADPEAESEGLDSAGHFEERQKRVLSTMGSLQSFAERVTKAKEALEHALCCPMTQQTVCKAVLAPDGQVYEESWILPWLRGQQWSPVTRAPMRSSQLLRDRVAEQAADAMWLLLGDGQPRDKVPPECPSTQPSLQSANNEAHHLHSRRPERGLLEAIGAGDEASALELLQAPGVPDGLNDRVGEEGATLLHLAMLNGLPAAALAIAQHPFFDGHDAFMGGIRQMVRPLHIAASLGLEDVCKALVQHCGGHIALYPLPYNVTLSMKSGGELLLRKDHDALVMARRCGHTNIATFLDAAIEQFMASW